MPIKLWHQKNMYYPVQISIANSCLLGRIKESLVIRICLW